MTYKNLPSWCPDSSIAMSAPSRSMPPWNHGCSLWSSLATIEMNFCCKGPSAFSSCWPWRQKQCQWGSFYNLRSRGKSSFRIWSSPPLVHASSLQSLNLDWKQLLLDTLLLLHIVSMSSERPFSFSPSYPRSTTILPSHKFWLKPWPLLQRHYRSYQIQLDSAG